MKKLLLITLAFSGIVYAPPARDKKKNNDLQGHPARHLAEHDIDGNGDHYRKSDRLALHRQATCGNTLGLIQSRKSLEKAYAQAQAAIAAAIESQKENCKPEEDSDLNEL